MQTLTHEIIKWYLEMGGLAYDHQLYDTEQLAEQAREDVKGSSVEDYVNLSVKSKVVYRKQITL